VGIHSVAKNSGKAKCSLSRVANQLQRSKLSRRLLLHPLQITIARISREAVGNAKITQLSKSGNDMSRGTPIERAIADAFKNAAESFGVAAYLDDQKFVIRYLKSKEDSRWATLMKMI